MTVELKQVVGSGSVCRFYGIGHQRVEPFVSIL
jgi:hypothetical protein